MDLAMIQTCSDTSLTPAIVKQFIDEAGSRDPLAITVRSGGRLVLVPKPRDADDALSIIRQNAGRAIVRVGVTQVPAGIGVKAIDDLQPDIFDTCQNLRKGTAMFAKILRIVSRWYGNPTSEGLFQQLFDDAIHAWKTGEFEGVSVFQAPDPGQSIDALPPDPEMSSAEVDTYAAPGKEPPGAAEAIGGAGIRVDLSRLDGEK